MRKSIVVAGYADVDIIKTIETFPQRHGLVSVTGMNRALGGAACNCVLDLARLDSGLRVLPIAVIGGDEYGAYIRGEFKKYQNIDMSLLLTGGQTAYTDVLDEADTRVRTFLVFRGANADFDVDSVDVDKLDCGIFHIGYICLLDALDRPDAEYGTRMARLLAKVQKKGILTSVDAITDSTLRHKTLMPAAMKYADIMCVNEHEAGAAFDIAVRRPDGTLDGAAAVRALKLFRENGVRKWAVIHAPETVWGMDEAGEIITVPGAVLPEGFIKGTVGAGDAFVSGLLIGAMDGKSLYGAIEMGIAAAVTSLTEAGASEGVRPMAEALRILDGLKRGE